MIYEAVHDIWALLIVDYATLPADFQLLVIMFELLTAFIFLKVLLYPFRMVLSFMYGTGRALFPRMFSTPRTRSYRNNDDD